MIKYRTEDEKNLAHVVNVSGGRSSAMMLLRCLEDGDLSSDRGDVALFNNTSCEHPETYAFLERLTARCEARGIPFYWTEYCTVEVYSPATKGYIRKPTYRMVLPQVFEPDTRPDGYKVGGECFEELCSYSGFLPNRWQRTCTAALKVKIKVDFLADWFSDKQEIEKQGHDGNASRITPEDWWRTHRRRGGKQDKETRLRFKAYLNDCPVSRPAQRFDRYSTIGKVHAGAGDSDNYLGIVGIRADEPQRVKRMMPIGGGGQEMINLPLVDNELTKKDVLDYWREFDSKEPGFGLQLPFDTEKTNCVYCFMKGSNKLREIARSDPKDETPASLAWWQRLEAKYRREFTKETFGQTDRCGSGFFGMFLVDDPKRKDYSNLSAVEDDGLPCHCTD